MRLTRQDWAKLQYPLLGLGLAVICMALLIWYAEQHKTITQSTLQEQEARLNQARQRYLSSGQERETIVQYLPAYQRLIRDGFVGEERRIEWVDSLRSIHQENKLFGIQYTIGAQEAYKPAYLMNPGPFLLQRSVMKLELAMLHEGDLLVLVDGLNARKSTPFIVRQCEILQRPGASFDKFIPNMQANCELDWLTVREPKVTGALQP
ncbi:hypothetical protein MTYP_02101 [Methylophilaceae bacterium]|nr:hypothetical protein MTYP_02101 [Methylophilaceae bacterium]